MAPPYSAFVDFLCVKVSKKYRNSPADFYWQIFREKKQTEIKDEEIHDTTKEEILGREMKTLYEKYCFLNGLLEEKLDEPNF